MGMFSLLMQYHKCWLYSDTKIIDFAIAQIYPINSQHVIFPVEAFKKGSGKKWLICAMCTVYRNAVNE